MNATAGEADLIRVVLADANVLYSRVLRDYLLYAADQEIIAVTWSRQILAEATEHLIKNVPGFDHAAGMRLVGAMNRAFPLAGVEPSPSSGLRRVTAPRPPRTQVGRAWITRDSTSGSRRDASGPPLSSVDDHVRLARTASSPSSMDNSPGIYAFMPVLLVGFYPQDIEWAHGLATVT